MGSEPLTFQRPATVYCVALPGIWKIGFSLSIRERLKELSREYGYACLVAGSQCKPESRKWLERYLHRAFSHRHLRGELFALTEDDLSLIRELPEFVFREADLPPRIIALHVAADLRKRFSDSPDVVRVVLAHLPHTCG